MIRLSVNDTVVVDPGQDVLLNCEIITGFPAPTVTWSRYPGPLPLSAQVRGPMLFLRAVTPADAGFYNCSAVNNVGNPARKNVNLIVRSKCTFLRVLGGFMGLLGVSFCSHESDRSSSSTELSWILSERQVKYPSCLPPFSLKYNLFNIPPLQLFLAPLIILAPSN